MLCVDEKTQIQALDRTQPIFPMLPTTTHAPVTTTSAMAPRACTQLSTSPREGDRITPFTSPRKRIHRVSPQDRRRGSRRSRCPPRDGPCIDPQDSRGQTIAPRALTLRHPLHTDQLIVDEPRRTLVRRTDHQEAPTLHAYLGPTAQQRHPSMDRDLERQPQTLRLGQGRRPDPRLHRTLLRQN